MENLAKAVLKVMQEVKGIEKSMTIGTGNSSYKGVSDQEVKKIIGGIMEKNGLCILPIDIEEDTQVDRWEEENFYNGKSQGIKTKQSIFTKVKTKYLLLHESGESQVLAGYGHGVDSQDKGAGKATTYALKYALLYTFLVPTGKIDDADNEHSDDKVVPTKKKEIPILPTLKISSEEYENIVDLISKRLIKKIESVEKRYVLSEEIKTDLVSKIDDAEKDFLLKEELDKAK